MFGWLKQWFGRKSPPLIRNFDDLSAALKSGAIKPHIRQEGDVQVLDPFAETGLSEEERKKAILRSFGFPAGIRMYVHRVCSGPYLAGLSAKEEAVFERDTEEWSPADLIGRFRDVTHCDHCGRKFVPTDDGYIAYWIASAEDLRLLEEVQREQAAERNADPSTYPYPQA